MGRIIALTTLVALGLGLLLYPNASNWFALRNQASELTGYARAVEAMSTDAQNEMLARAEAYNDELRRGRTGQDDSTYAEYKSHLSPQPGDVMADVTIPDLRITLPIYHGTSDDVLHKGAGHLFGTSLPVGGTGTHAVISAHSGLASAQLFTHLEDLDVGDLFSISVVGRRLVYEIDHIEAVLPDDISKLGIDPDKDYVTLLTCTPTAVNSHRLLVRGHRVQPLTAAQEEQVIAGRNVNPGFPWWAVQWGGGTLAAFVLGKVTNRRAPKPAKRQAKVKRRPQASPFPAGAVAVAGWWHRGY